MPSNHSRTIGRVARGLPCGPRLLVMAALVIFSLVSYVMLPKEMNPFTGEEQRVTYTVDEEVALGLQSAPLMARQFGGLHADPQLQATIDRIGNRLVQADSRITGSGYNFEFHLLADTNTVNAFALPGGQIFFTHGLFKMLKSEDEVAGVLGHEIGHVIARHSNEQISKSKLVGGVLQGVVVGASDDYSSAQISQGVANFVGNMINTKYGRDDESQSDDIGFTLLAAAGYDPAAMLGVMQALKSASAGQRQPEFLSSHPLPETRIQRVQQLIETYRQSGKTPY